MSKVGIWPLTSVSFVKLFFMSPSKTFRFLGYVPSCEAAHFADTAFVSAAQTRVRINLPCLSKDASDRVRYTSITHHASRTLDHTCSCVCRFPLLSLAYARGSGGSGRHVTPRIWPRVTWALDTRVPNASIICLVCSLIWSDLVW